MNSIPKTKLETSIRQHLFADLFIQHGWDEGSPEPLHLKLSEDETAQIQRVASKSGFAVCIWEAGERYLESRSQVRRLVSELMKYHYEHLLIVCGKGKQRWIVGIVPQNKPLRTYEVEWHENQDIQPLVQKLDGVIFSLEDEEKGIAITDVVEKVRSAFVENAERITKKFYAEFRKELGAFAEFIEGIGERVSRDWYAALMLNRLMFIYFIQKRHFLDGDTAYLENRLAQTKRTQGRDKFHQHFYRHFLKRLFHEGLGTPEDKRNPELAKLLGKVPYLNGGLFDPHQIEEQNADIDIPDKAFENLFGFFRQYNWNLDSRPTSSGKDINPDVIGYIFEKYINDRASMGAYYTQEDITGYIARCTVIPFLLARAKDNCANAFEQPSGIWRFLQENPDGYIYEAVRKGCDIPDEELPENIRRGIDTEASNLLERRSEWNTPTPKRFGLPTEIWRETMARRKRYFDLKAKLQNGEIRLIEDLITYNLDIQRFAGDALRYYEGSDFIAAFFKAIVGKADKKTTERGLTVLDPACGSGAFLFAALGVLEPLYEGCIERMRSFVEDDDKLHELGGRKGTKKYPQFRELLDDIDAHPNQRYWIYKTIILNNLYGVDIMREAAEIAKLRLFLKLAAEAEYAPHKRNMGLEPLPDIDFNIRSGNSLVGFASMKEFKEFASIDTTTGQYKSALDSSLTDEIREEAKIVQMASERFRYAQGHGGEGYRQAKDELSGRLEVLNEKMNRYLAAKYGKYDKAKEGEYEQWKASHQPFHWMAEFYGIIEEDGGFDVVIGNPPYVEYSKVRKDYIVRDYKTESCGNLYAFFVEKTFSLRVDKGGIGMIVQLPIICTDRMIPLQKMFAGKYEHSWFLNFDDRPGKLFADLQHIRATIFINTTRKSLAIFSTKYKRWHSHIRETIFEDIKLHNIEQSKIAGVFPKLEDTIDTDIFSKILNQRGIDYFLSNSRTKNSCYFHNAPQYWIRATDFVPYFWNERDGEKQSVQVKSLSFQDRDHALAVCALLNSSLFYWWFIVCSDCRHLNMREIGSFPLDIEQIDEGKLHRLSGILSELMESYRSHAVRKETNYKTTGKVVYDEFYPRHSKAIIDKIDVLLAEHYGFTEEELDYIINYDIKYRMGLAK